MPTMKSLKMFFVEPLLCGEDGSLLANVCALKLRLHPDKLRNARVLEQAELSAVDVVS